MKLYTNAIGVMIAMMFGTTTSAQTDSTSLSEMSLKDLLNVKVTTASKTLQEISTAPASIIVITKEQIVQRGYRSLLDLITDLPDYKVDDKIYSGQRNSVTIRGIQGQQNFFVLLDGIRISSPTNEALPIMENYPLHLAQQVEIIYGPASALYGADAVAGVINIITRKMPDNKDAVVDVSASAGTYGYTNNTLYLAKRIGEKSSIVLSGQYAYDKQPDYSSVYSGDNQNNVDHYRTGIFNTIYGEMRPQKPVAPDYEAPTMAYNIYGALHVEDFTLSVFSNYTRTPTAWGNNTQNAVYNKDVYMGQSVSSVAASYRKLINSVTTTSTLSATRYNLDPESNYRNLYTGMDPVYKYSTCLSIKAEEQLDYKISSKWNLTAGVTHERFSTVPQSADLEHPVERDGNIEGTYAGTSQYYRPGGLPAQFYNIMYHNTGFYLQTQYAPNTVLNFTLGARYDYNSRYGETFNPRLGIVFRPTTNTTIKAMYGSAYLAPPVSTAYVTYGSFTTMDSGKTYSSTFLHLPNPGLGPVRSHTFELNAQQYLTHDLNVSIGGYYTLLNGLFEFADDNQSTHLYNNEFNGIPVDYIEVFINEDRSRIWGANFQVAWKHSVGNIFFNSYGSLSYVKGYQYEPPSAASDYRTELSFLAPLMIRIGTDVKAGKFMCSPRLLLMGRQNLPGVSDTSGNTIKLQTIPGYALLNVSLRYQFTRNLAAYVNVFNTLNQRYRVPGFNMDLNKKDTELFYGQPQDPIRFQAGLNFSL